MVMAAISDISYDKAAARNNPPSEAYIESSCFVRSGY